MNKLYYLLPRPISSDHSVDYNGKKYKIPSMLRHIYHLDEIIFISNKLALSHYYCLGYDIGTKNVFGFNLEGYSVIYKIHVPPRGYNPQVETKKRFNALIPSWLVESITCLESKNGFEFITKVMDLLANNPEYFNPIEI